MSTFGYRKVLALSLILLSFSFIACSSSKNVTPEINRVQKIAPALSPADRLIQFVRTGDSQLLNGIFTDSVLQRMSIDEMVQTRKDFVSSFGRLIRAEGPNFDSDTSATIVLVHENMTLAANIIFDKRGLIKDLSIKQGLGDGHLGAF